MGDCDIGDCVDLGPCCECGFELCFRCGSTLCEIGVDVCAPAISDGCNVCGEALGDGCTAIGSCCSSCGAGSAHVASAAAEGVGSASSSCCSSGGGCHACLNVASACCDCWCRPGYWFIDFSPSSSTSGGYWGCYSCDYGWSRRARQRCRNITLFVLFALMLALVVAGSVYIADKKGVEGRPLLGVGVASGIVFILLSTCLLYACCERRLEEGPSPSALRLMPNWAQPEALRAASARAWMAHLPKNSTKIHALEADILRRHSKDAAAPPIDWRTGDAAVEIRRAADGSVYREASTRVASSYYAAGNGFAKDHGPTALATATIVAIAQQSTAPPITAFSEAPPSSSSASTSGTATPTSTAPASIPASASAGAGVVDGDDHADLRDVPSVRSIYMLGESQVAWTTQLERLRVALNKKDALIVIRRATAAAADPSRDVPPWLLDAFRQTAEAKRNGPDGHRIWTTSVRVAFGDLLRLLIARISAAEAARGGGGAVLAGAGAGGEAIALHTPTSGGSVASADAVALQIMHPHPNTTHHAGVLAPPPPPPIALRAALGVPKPAPLPSPTSASAGGQTARAERARRATGGGGSTQESYGSNLNL